jgi:hypothetical protein
MLTPFFSERGYCTLPSVSSVETAQSGVSRSAPRRATGTNTHGLLASGHKVLETLFSGITKGLIAAGAMRSSDFGCVKMVARSSRIDAQNPH